MSRHVIPPQHAMRFRSGRRCLDFVHTGEDEHMRELIHQPADLAFFLAAILDVGRVTATAANVVAARQLRDAIRDCVVRTMNGGRLVAADVATINAFAARPCAVPSLTTAATVHTESASANEALSSIARDAIELFAANLGDRIRTCAADDCGLFLLDMSRPNLRRWCSMELCGNRSKMRSFRSRAHADD